MTDKLTPAHLALKAYVYVRQSTQQQVRTHHESRRRQYALAVRAGNWDSPASSSSTRTWAAVAAGSSSARLRATVDGDLSERGGRGAGPRGLAARE